ncbi:MAG TPA: helix-turn-helix domain-containing protein [Candidatus Saccharimonadales bacterium]
MNVEKSNNVKVVAYLKQLGLTHEQSEAYIFLLSHGQSTVLQMSRGLKTGRTKLYPLLEDLAEKQLIHIHERHYGTTYEAQDLQTLDFLVSEHERKSNNLRKSLPAAQSILTSLVLDSPSSTRIVEYRGIDGLKQMNFNLTKAEKEFRVFELAGLDKHLGKHFAEKMRERVLERGLTTYDLTNRPNRKSEPGAELPNAHIRYIDPQIFTIEFETYVYDNVVSLLSYDHDDIFGVEIHSEKFARQQRAIFDAFWEIAK